MPNPLFNKFGNMYNYPRQQNVGNNLMTQLMMLKNNPSVILDIMLQNGKINQYQYNDLKQYANNPEMIVRYLASNGKNAELSHAEQIANQIRNNN